MKKYQIIEIKWLDSLHTSGWTKESNVECSTKKLFHKTIGYFLIEDKLSIIVIQSQPEEGKDKFIDGIMEIPKKSIIKIRKLN